MRQCLQSDLVHVQSCESALLIYFIYLHYSAILWKLYKPNIRNNLHKFKTRNQQQITVPVLMCALYASQFQPRASPPQGKPPGIPRTFEKIIQMPGPAGNFCWQMPRPPFLLWWSNARPSSPSDQYTKLLVAIF